MGYDKNMPGMNGQRTVGKLEVENNPESLDIYTSAWKNCPSELRFKLCG